MLKWKITLLKTNTLLMVIKTINKKLITTINLESYLISNKYRQETVDGAVGSGTDSFCRAGLKPTACVQRAET